MKEELRRLKSSLVNRFGGFKRQTTLQKPSHYYEVYGEFGKPPYRFPFKENYKNGVLIGKSALATPVFDKKYLDEESKPSFVKGRCEIVGGGDYKTVIAEEGNSDFVIKIYNWHFYDGEGAEHKAELAAKKIKIIHQIAEEIAPGFVLPSKMIIARHKGGYGVYEKQQRALVLPIDYFDPEIAEKLHQEATRVAIEGTHKVEEKLLEMGVSRKDPFLLFNSITDDLSLTEIHWDLKTSHLVSLDIVDRVDINNLSLSYLGSKDKT